MKDDGRNPTASFEDRASAIAVVKVQEKGIGAAAIPITTASTGNAAAALAGLCASVQHPNVIFVPESAPPAKIAQLLRRCYSGPRVSGIGCGTKISNAGNWIAHVCPLAETLARLPRFANQSED